MTPLRAFCRRALLPQPTAASLLPTARPRPQAAFPSVDRRQLSASAAAPMAAQSKEADWSADQYLKFHDERTRAVHDLVNRIPLPGGRLPLAADSGGDGGGDGGGGTASRPLRIIDLGCGPGNSTTVLAARFPGAELSGVDASPNMIAKARAALPGVPFALADLQTYDPLAAAGGAEEPAPAPAPAAAPDLLLANAVLQWIARPARLATVLRLFGAVRPGGVLAFQVPDNTEERMHRAILEVARGEAPGTADGPWVPVLRGLGGRDAIETPEQLYDALVPHSRAVDVWHAVYYHALPGGARAIVEWLRGTGLQPWVHALPDEATKQAFLAAYEARVAQLYEPRADGAVLIRYPRLFVVAVKK